jgi:23S rRNA pseudouridine2457 synthase
VLSQFTLPAGEAVASAGKQTLKDIFMVPKDVYPVGRLDYDSEGLLLLTNDIGLNHRLLHPSFGHEREYWVQVEGEMDDTAMNRLRSGMEITIDGKPYHTKKCRVAPLLSTGLIPERTPPIRFRKNIPATWIRLVLTEGKNRQVRRMTAKAGYPTLRLIRYRIARLTLEGLAPGGLKELQQKELYQLLF